MKTEYHHSAGNHVVNLPLPVDFPQVNQRTTTDGKSIIQPPKIEHTYTIQCSIYYQYIITLIIYRLYCLICLEIAMCPFYEYPTHNNQHAFFFKKRLLCFLRSIHCNYIEWFSWFTNFGIMSQHQVCQSMVHHRDPTGPLTHPPGLPPAALKSETRRHDAKRPLEAVATSMA